MKYQQPQVTGERLLESQLRSISELKGASDADIKHGVEPVGGYEAPAISEERDLEGSLIPISAIE